MGLFASREDQDRGKVRRFVGRVAGYMREVRPTTRLKGGLGAVAVASVTMFAERKWFSKNRALGQRPWNNPYRR